MRAHHHSSLPQQPKAVWRLPQHGRHRGALPHHFYGITHSSFSSRGHECSWHTVISVSNKTRVVIFRPLVLRITAHAEPDRSPWVRRIYSQVLTTTPIHMRLPTDIGLRCYPPPCPPHMPYGASLSFAMITAPMTSTRRALAGNILTNGPGAPDSRPCLFSVGFPPLGPRDFTSYIYAVPGARIATLRSQRRKLLF